MLKISVEHRGALTLQRHTVEVTIDDRGRAFVATWEGSACLARAGVQPQGRRALDDAEIAALVARLDAVEMRLAPLPDHSEMYDGWTTTLTVQDAYTTFSLRWFCAAPSWWRGVEELAAAVQAVAEAAPLGERREAGRVEA